MEEDPKVEIKRKIKLAFKLGNYIPLSENDYNISLPFYMGDKEARLHLRRGNVSDVDIKYKYDECIITEHTDLRELIITDFFTFCLYNLYERTCIVSLPLKMATPIEVDILGKILPNFTIVKSDSDSLYDNLCERIESINTKGENKKIDLPILFEVQ